MLRVQTSGDYTFMLKTSCDSAKLRINTNDVIVWPISSGTLWLQAGSFVDLSLLCSHAASAHPFLSLLFSSNLVNMQVIPMELFYLSSALLSNGVSVATVFPATLCASTSTLQLKSTIIAVAAPLSFDVIPKDQYGNIRLEPSSSFADCSLSSCKVFASLRTSRTYPQASLPSVAATVSSAFSRLYASDSQYFPSSVLSSAARGATYFQPQLDSLSSWTANSATPDSSIFIDIDALGVVAVGGVITQGRSSNAQWVTAFTVSHSDDGQVFAVLGSFSGNTNYNDWVYNMFPRIIYTRFIRITPTARNGHIRMRLDLLLVSNGGNLPSTVTPLSATQSSLSAALTGDIGLMATYYGDSAFSNPLVGRMDRVYFSSVDIPQARSVRWFGIYKSASASAHTFSVDHNVGMRVWLDDILIIDQASILASSKRPRIHHWRSLKVILRSKSR